MFATSTALAALTAVCTRLNGRNKPPCFCKNDEAANFGSDDECPDCGHLKKYHKTNSGNPQLSYDQQVSNSLGPTFDPRLPTVSHLASLLFTHKVIQLIDPPTSGKSTLLKLLHIYLNNTNPTYDIHYFPTWPQVGWRECSAWDDMLAKENLKLTSTEQLNDPNHKFVILVDEGESSFGDVLLWHMFLKDRVIGRMGWENIFFVVAACTSYDDYAEEAVYSKPYSISRVWFHPDSIVGLYVTEEGKLGVRFKGRDEDGIRECGSL